MYIIGSIPQLGNFQQPKKMKLVSKKHDSPYEKYWETQFYIHVKIEAFNYLFVQQDRANKKFFFERREKRSLNLIHSIQVQIESNKKQLPFNPYAGNSSRSFSYINNSFKIIDWKFMDDEFAKPVTQNLIIGNFPYFESEVEDMLNYQVKAVLNINNLGEFKCNCINWDIITQQYQAHNIEFVDYLYEDSNKKSQFNKIQEAAELLNEMIQKYEVVFMHGVLGNNLTTKIVLEYLCKYKKFSLEAGIKFLNQKQIPIFSFLSQAEFGFRRRTKQKAHSAKLISKKKNNMRVKQQFKFMKNVMGLSFQTAYYQI